MLADAAGNGGELALGAGAIDDEVPVFVGKGDEIAFGVDHAMLHPGRALFEQAPQEVGLAGSGIALDQEAGRQQLLKIKHGRRAAGGFSHVDRDVHVSWGILRGIGRVRVP